MSLSTSSLGFASSNLQILKESIDLVSLAMIPGGQSVVDELWALLAVVLLTFFARMYVVDFRYSASQLQNRSYQLTYKFFGQQSLP